MKEVIVLLMNLGGIYYQLSGSLNPGVIFQNLQNVIFTKVRILQERYTKYKRTSVRRQVFQIVRVDLVVIINIIKRRKMYRPYQLSACRLAV